MLFRARGSALQSKEGALMIFFLICKGGSDFLSTAELCKVAETHSPPLLLICCVCVCIGVHFVCMCVYESLSYIIDQGLLHGWLVFGCAHPCCWCGRFPARLQSVTDNLPMSTWWMCCPVCECVCTLSQHISPSCLLFLLRKTRGGKSEEIWRISGRARLRDQTHKFTFVVCMNIPLTLQKASAETRKRLQSPLIWSLYIF